MNILVVSNSVWDNQNSFGNTLSNWFSEWQSARFLVLYRSDKPSNTCCSEYYLSHPFEIINKIVTPDIGIRYEASNIPSNGSMMDAKVKG